MLSRIRQVAPISTSSNTWFPAPTQVCRHEWHLDQFGRFCTAFTDIQISQISSRKNTAMKAHRPGNVQLDRESPRSPMLLSNIVSMDMTSTRLELLSERYWWMVAMLASDWGSIPSFGPISTPFCFTYLLGASLLSHEGYTLHCATHF